MRTDMNKVIVERPRKGGHKGEYAPPRDLDDSPKQEGLRRRHRDRKWLNETLRPLERYIASQAGRPWDKVHSEICAHIDRRNTVQQHILQHLDQFVSVDVKEIDGVLCELLGQKGYVPIARSNGPRHYVDPRTGLLRENRAGLARLPALEARVPRAPADPQRGRARGSPHPRCDDADAPDRRRLVPRRARAGAAAWSAGDDPIDALRHVASRLCPATRDAGAMRSNLSLFGDPGLYARCKRQLRAAELREHGLANAIDTGNDARGSQAARRTRKLP